MAAKAAWLSVCAGEHEVASACAGEFASRWFRPSFYEGTALVDAKGRLRPEAEFLRFTLSDGAGAIVIEPTPRPGALRIRFVDIVSLAGRFDHPRQRPVTEKERRLVNLRALETIWPLLAGGGG